MTPPSTVPQLSEALAVATVSQTLPASVLQYSPNRASHRLPPSATLQEAPRIAKGAQVPSALPVFPRQVRPGAQALLSLQGPEASAGATHSKDTLSHSRPAPQLLLEQESPSPGDAAHTPQVVVFETRQ